MSQMIARSMILPMFVMLLTMSCMDCPCDVGCVAGNVPLDVVPVDSVDIAEEATASDVAVDLQGETTSVEVSPLETAGETLDVVIYSDTDISLKEIAADSSGELEPEVTGEVTDDAVGEALSPEIIPACPVECPTYCLEGVCQPCPEDMKPVQGACVDYYEAPNKAGALPFVMFTFVEATAWCDARGKRLCLDSEWTEACGGPEGWTYPYGDQHQKGVCNDDEVWKSYIQSKLSKWPWSLSVAGIESLDELLVEVSATGPDGATAAEHILWLYQAEPSGENSGCVNEYGVFDLCGNVEEWTKRADGGKPDFHGNLKGRYWAELRTWNNTSRRALA